MSIPYNRLVGQKGIRMFREAVAYYKGIKKGNISEALIRIQGGRYLHEVILLILNGLIERSEQIIKKAHKVNQSVILNKNAFNCSVQLL